MQYIYLQLRTKENTEANAAKKNYFTKEEILHQKSASKDYYIIKINNYFITSERVYFKI